MEDSTQRKIDKFQREDVFTAENVGDFKAPKAAAMAAEATALTNEILSLAAAQTSGFDDKAQGFEQLETARENLFDDLTQINSAARILADEIDGIEDKFRRPYRPTDQNLLAKARSFMIDAAPLQTPFVEAGLENDFLEDLTADIAAFEAARAAVSSALEAQSAATGSLADSVRRRMNLSRKLSAFVKIKFRNAAGKLAAWTVASHLERPPKKPKPPTP